MSELKSYIAPTADGTGLADYYLKSEADKVIAELKESIKNLILDNYLKDKEICHHKYKRCLAMARWCEEVDLFGGYTSNYWMRWRNKWLELAEKFKEAK